MKLRTKLVSNREQTKIQVSLSPPCPSPHPTHQQQTRSTAKATCAVFCSKPGPDPGSRPAASVQWDPAPGVLSATAAFYMAGGDFQNLLGALLFSSSPAISWRLSPGEELRSERPPTQWWVVNCPSLLGSLSRSRRLLSPLLPH